MKIEATIVLPVKVTIEIPGPLDNLTNVKDNDFPELWKNWKIKVMRKLFAEAESIFKSTSPLARISTCSLTELEGEVNIYPEDIELSPEDELPPTVKAMK